MRVAVVAVAAPHQIFSVVGKHGEDGASAVGRPDDEPGHDQAVFANVPLAELEYGRYEIARAHKESFATKHGGYRERRCPRFPSSSLERS